MKRKDDFITNSSSCSFVLPIPRIEVCKKINPECIVIANCTQLCEEAKRYISDYHHDIMED